MRVTAAGSQDTPGRRAYQSDAELKELASPQVQPLIGDIGVLRDARVS